MTSSHNRLRPHVAAEMITGSVEKIRLVQEVIKIATCSKLDVAGC